MPQYYIQAEANVIVPEYYIEANFIPSRRWFRRDGAHFHFHRGQAVAARVATQLLGLTLVRSVCARVCEHLIFC